MAVMMGVMIINPEQGPGKYGCGMNSPGSRAMGFRVTSSKGGMRK
jgi:hypothetical protein